MTGESIELVVEFGVIVCAPIIHNYYLWKVKKVDVSIIKQNIKIFSFLYLMVMMCVALLIIRSGVQL